MSELIRDTIFGHFVRIVTGKRFLKYQEEIDPSLWKKYVSKEKSANMAVHGTVEKPSDDEKKEEDDAEREQRPRGESNSSSDTQIADDENVNKPSGKKIDSENGKDAHVVDWWGDDDPEVRQKKS